MAKSENSTNSRDASSEPQPRPWQSYHTVYTDAKAGMDGVDKEKVQRIVYEMSKGSKYFENEERKEAYMTQKIENMHAQCAKLSAGDIAHHQKVADKRILELEATRDLSRIWLHVDMDAFYAAVETLCDPSLKGKPMAVGSLSMISTANYEARKFGVRAAMPGFIARKLCPELIFVPVDFKKYTHYSNLTRQVFQRYDPNFLAMSLDEAYLDITNICTKRSITGKEVAQDLRETVYNDTGLTCSAGVGPNRLLAKVCSDINKPNGQFVLPNDQTAVTTFISSLPIRKIGGIGKVTERILKDVFGITTCEEMLQKSGFLCGLFSRSSADFFLSVGLGLGGTDTPQIRMRKSISNERTFAATKDEALLYQKLVDLAAMLSADMRKENLRGRTLTLKLKTSSFEVRTRAVTLPNYTCSSEDILKHASKLLKAELPVSLRLMGLRMSHFSEERNGAPSDPTQRTLSDFVIGTASGEKIGGHSVLGSYCSDDILSANCETSLSSESHEPCASIESVDDGLSSELKHGDYLLRQNGAAKEENSRRQSDEPMENINDGDTGVQVFMSCGGVHSHLVMEYPSREQSDGSSLGNGNSRTILADLDAGSSSKHKEPFFWIDDYKCSLCGVQLPPNFIEERQEHSDFHLAERLQEEESCENHKNILKHRSIQKSQVATQNRPRKKNKSSPAGSKHLPIDVFFTKTSQNF